MHREGGLQDAPTACADRLVGWVRGERPGPLLLCVGGLHGNEGAGTHALEAVVEGLEARTERMAGDFVAVRGNLRALASGRRFIDHDLNRAWTEERVESLRGPQVPGTVEAADAEEVELLEIIGRGGMGLVYKARQRSLKRIVALKTIRPEHLESKENRERFRIEAEAAARLDHPAIVSVFQVFRRQRKPLPWQQRSNWPSRLVPGFISRPFRVHVRSR